MLNRQVSGRLRSSHEKSTAAHLKSCRIIFYCFFFFVKLFKYIDNNLRQAMCVITHVGNTIF